MFFLLDNILPHRTCLKPRGKIIKKCTKDIFLLQHMGHQIHMAMMASEFLLTWWNIFLLGYIFDMSSESIREYSNWHGWNRIGIYFLAPIRKLMLSLTCSPNSNPLFPPIINEVSKNLWTFLEFSKTYFQPHWTLNPNSYRCVCTLLISFDPHRWFWNEKRSLNVSSTISLKNTLIIS